jgi:hypothetical protein
MLYAAKTISRWRHPHSRLRPDDRHDIAMSTVFALAIIIFMGFRLRQGHRRRARQAPAHLGDPRRRHGGDLVKSSWGQGQAFIPLGVTVFLFVLVSNWIGFLPTAMHPGSSGEIFPPRRAT